MTSSTRKHHFHYIRLLDPVHTNCVSLHVLEKYPALEKCTVESIHFELACRPAQFYKGEEKSSIGVTAATGTSSASVGSNSIMSSAVSSNNNNTLRKLNNSFSNRWFKPDLPHRKMRLRPRSEALSSNQKNFQKRLDDARGTLQGQMYIRRLREQGKLCEGRYLSRATLKRHYNANHQSTRSYSNNVIQRKSSSEQSVFGTNHSQIIDDDKSSSLAKRLQNTTFNVFDPMNASGYLVFPSLCSRWGVQFVKEKYMNYVESDLEYREGVRNERPAGRRGALNPDNCEELLEQVEGTGRDPYLHSDPWTNCSSTLETTTTNSHDTLNNNNDTSWLCLPGIVDTVICPLYRTIEKIRVQLVETSEKKRLPEHQKKFKSAADQNVVTTASFSKIGSTIDPGAGNNAGGGRRRGSFNGSTGGLGLKCKVCGNIDQRSFIHDVKEGTTVCIKCGLVIAEGRIIDLGKRQFQDDPKSRANAHHGIPANPLMSSASQLNITFSKSAYAAPSGKGSRGARRKEVNKIVLEEMRNMRKRYASIQRDQSDRSTTVEYKDRMKEEAFSKIKHMAHAIGIGTESGIVYKAMELFAFYRDYKEHVYEYEATVVAALLQAWRQTKSGREMAMQKTYALNRKRLMEDEERRNKRRKSLANKNGVHSMKIKREGVRNKQSSSGMRLNIRQMANQPFKMRTFDCKKCGMQFDSRQERKFHRC